MSENLENKVEGEKKQERVEEKEISKGNKKTKIIIAIIAILVLIASAVGGYFAYQYIEDKKPIEQEWADTYYKYLKASEEEETSENKIKQIKSSSDLKIGFVDVAEVENPIMVAEYEKDKKTVTDIFYINDGIVKNVINLDISNLELLYDISDKKYDWYTHKETETVDTYKKVSEQISGNDATSTENTETKTDTEYTYTKGEEISVDTVDGNKISIPKFDTEFVKTDVKIDKMDYKEDMSDKELKAAIIEEVDKYKPVEEIITEEIKNEVTKKENEVTAKQEEMKKAEEVRKAAEEEARRKAEEEEKKRAEEEAAKGIQAGNYTLKYGTYKGTEVQMGYDDDFLTTEITLTLKQDGTYTLKSSNTSLVSNSSGTFKIEKNTYQGTEGTHILKLNSGNFYSIIANNTLQMPAGSGATFTYQGY